MVLARPGDAQRNYNPSNNPNSLVFDSSLRTISNLIVDQTLGNPGGDPDGPWPGRQRRPDGRPRADHPDLRRPSSRPSTPSIRRASSCRTPRPRPTRSRRRSRRRPTSRDRRHSTHWQRPRLLTRSLSAIWTPRASCAMRRSSPSASPWTATTFISPTSRPTRVCRRRSIPGSRCSASSSITVSTSSTRAAAAPCSFRSSRMIRSTSRAATPISWC